MTPTTTRRTASVILFTLAFSTTAVLSAVGPAISAKASTGAPIIVSAPLA